MDWHEFKRLDNKKPALLEKFLYLKGEGLRQYQESALSIFDLKRFPSLNAEKVIHQTIYKTLKEKGRRDKEKYYYVANARCFLEITHEILTPNFLESFERYIGSGENDVLIYNYYELFQTLLLDAVYVLTCYEKFCLEKEPTVDIVKNPTKHPLEIYMFAKQTVYGQHSLHSTRDKAHEMSIAMIRQMIELRLRRAFGVIGKYSRLDGTFEPVPMSLIFGILKEACNKDTNCIDFSVPLDDIERIYSWANLFIHAGLTDFCWKPLNILNYLQTFMTGQTIGNTRSVHYGICMREDTLSLVREKIAESLKSKQKALWSVLWQWIKKKRRVQDYEPISLRNPEIYLKPPV